MEPLDFLDSVSGYVRGESRSSADKPMRLAVVDPAYDPEADWPDAPTACRVTFEGETVLSVKAYPLLAGVYPLPGQRVMLAPVGNTYVVVGAIGTQVAQGFWQSADGADSGTEFGGGSYIDTDSGLVVAGDAAVAGDLEVTGVGNRQYRLRTTAATAKTTATTAIDTVLTGIVLTPGTWKLEVSLVMLGTTGDFKSNWDFTGTWSGVKAVRGPSAATELQDFNNTMMRSGGHGLTTDITYGLNSAASAVAREWAMVTVTDTGTWSIRWAQETANAASSNLNGGSFMTAERWA